MPRPFYLIGHNTNSIQEIRDGLAAGLNAFEIDVNRDPRDELYVAHDFVADPPPHGVPSVKPPKLDVFLRALRQLALSPEGAGMALVIVDSKVKSAALGAEIARSVRAHLTGNAALLPVIYSVAKVADAQTFFEQLHVALPSKEGLMIDEESDPALVAHFFQGLGVRRGCYGNGVTTIAGVGLPTPNLPVQMDASVAIRAVGNLRFAYPWVLRQPDTMAEFVRIGVNGIMVDTGRAGALAGVLRRAEFSNAVRSATRADDPFADDHSPMLQIRTADVAHAGTDARITFTLELAGGQSVQKSVDAAFNGRFERGSLNFVLLPEQAFALADVRAVTVSHDGSGNAPDWQLATITLRKRGELDRIATFDRVVTTGSPARAQL